MNWIDCRERMPEEKAWHEDGRNYSDGKDRDWTESERVLVWDSMYGPSVSSTRNGEWMCDKNRADRGYSIHSVVAWMPIPEMDIEDYKL